MRPRSLYLSFLRYLAAPLANVSLYPHLHKKYHKTQTTWTSWRRGFLLVSEGWLVVWSVGWLAGKGHFLVRHGVRGYYLQFKLVFEIGVGKQGKQNDKTDRKESLLRVLWSLSFLLLLQVGRSSFAVIWRESLLVLALFFLASVSRIRYPFFLYLAASVVVLCRTCISYCCFLAFLILCCLSSQSITTDSSRRMSGPGLRNTGVHDAFDDRQQDPMGG